jgi:hypothetical protein
VANKLLEVASQPKYAALAAQAGRI